MIGRQTNSTEINNGLSTTVVLLRSALDAAARLRIFLTNHTDADLEAFGFAGADDIFLLRAAVQDLGKLYDVFHGAAEVTPAYDFRQYTQLVTAID